MGHAHINGDQSAIKINVTMPCGCCNFEIALLSNGEATVKSKGLSEQELLSKLDGLATALPETLQAIVATGKANLSKKSVVH